MTARLCNEGYSPNHKSLFCHLGNFEPPTYVCEPDPCVVHEVANKLGSGCAGVPHPAMINSGAACRTQCIEGYTPSVPEQKCNAAVMTPTFWTCIEDACQAPSGITHAPLAFLRSLEGEKVEAGNLCTAQCAEGYRPSVASLACSMGKLAPASFSCNPEPCVIPDVANREGSGCRGIRGKTVAAGTTCAPVCKNLPLQFGPGNAGQTLAAWSPSIGPLERAAEMEEEAASSLAVTVRHGAKTGRLSCYAGIFSPSTFLCQPKPCKLPAVQNRGGSGCTGVPGESIASGTVCQTQCIGGYTASVNQLTCTAEVLTPASFECTPNACPLPTVTNARGNGCRGIVGTVLASGAECSTICNRGYSPSVAKLECFAGTLSPPGYICTEDDCDAEGAKINGGRTCTPRCEAGYSPSRTSLACRRGVLDPATFACQADSCDMPFVANSMNPTCAEGNTLTHGQRCTPKCKSGYLPSESSLLCTAGSLSPATFTCRAPCPAPNAGYQPNKGTLECNDGVLTGGPVFCSSAPPPVGGNFFNCWTGDPHFVCRNGKRTDPLVPGTHWVFKQSCPGSPNFMWVQGLFGPRRPSCTLGTAFGGNFLGMTPG
eukprot:s473_g19.t1